MECKVCGSYSYRSICKVCGNRVGGLAEKIIEDARQFGKVLQARKMIDNEKKREIQRIDDETRLYYILGHSPIIQKLLLETGGQAIYNMILEDLLRWKYE